MPFMEVGASRRIKKNLKNIKIPTFVLEFLNVYQWDVTYIINPAKNTYFLSAGNTFFCVSYVLERYVVINKDSLKHVILSY